MLQDLYRDLGLDKKATPDQVKRAYHRKAKGSHPDTGGDAEQFARVKRAYDVLSDPKRRLTYDKTGHAEDPAPDNDHVKAMEIIASLVEHFIAGTDETVFAIDLVQVMRQELSQMRGRCHTQLFQAQRKVARAEKLAKRFRARGRVNQIRRMIEGRRDLFARNLTDINSALRQIDLALELLKDYSFDRELCVSKTSSVLIT